MITDVFDFVYYVLISILLACVCVCVCVFEWHVWVLAWRVWVRLLVLRLDCVCLFIVSLSIVYLSSMLLTHPPTPTVHPYTCTHPLSPSPHPPTHTPYTHTHAHTVHPCIHTPYTHTHTLYPLHPTHSHRHNQPKHVHTDCKSRTY